MNRPRRLALASLGASAVALTVGFVTSGTEILLLPLGSLVVLGVVGEGRGSAWTPTAWFLAQAGLTALARSSPVWALISISGALAYWDLSAFHRRKVKAGRVEMPELMLKRHVAFLSIGLALGAGLGAAALLVRIESGFAGALLFGLVALAGLSQLLRRALAPTGPVDRLGPGQAERNS